MILHLQIVEAKDIPRMDPAPFTADPFVLFRLSTIDEEYQTKVIKQNLRPVWNEEFHIPFNPTKNPILHMELFDWDKLTKNDLISTRDFQISDYEPGKVFDKWVDFFAAPKVKKPGQVHLVFHIADPHEIPFKEREPEPAPVVKSVKKIEPEPEPELEPEPEPEPEIPVDKYQPYKEQELKNDATEEEKEEYDYNHKIRQLTELISTSTDGYLKPINFCYVDRLINIRGRNRPIAIFLKPVSSELSENGVFIYDTTRMAKDKAIYFFVHSSNSNNLNSKTLKTLEQFGEQIIQSLSTESNCTNIIRINDMNSPEFDKMIHQMGGHKRMIQKEGNYGDELIVERSFFKEKLSAKIFSGTKRTTCGSVDFDSVPQNGAMVINPKDFALYLYLDNIDPKNDEEKQSLMTAIEWMKNQPNFDKKELFVFDKSRIPSTVQLFVKKS